MIQVVVPHRTRKMDLNPYAAEKRKIDTAIYETEQKIQHLNRQVDSYTLYNKEKELEEITSCKTEIESIQATIQAYELTKPSNAWSNWDYAWAGVATIAHIASVFVSSKGIATFADDRLEIAKKAREEQWATWHAQYIALLASQEDSNNRSADLEGRIREHAVFDFVQAKKSSEALNLELESFRELRIANLIKYEAVDKAIGQQIDEIEAIDTLLQDLLRKSEIAARYQQLLSATEIKWEKSRIHEQCKLELGSSSPGRLQSEFAEQRKPLIRRQEKFVSEARARVRVLTLGITKVVIDGNNMCHLPMEKGFIGLGPIKAAADALIKSGLTVVIIFDPSIRKLPGCPRGNAATAWLRYQTGARFVMIVPDDTRADESILREAADSKSAVISRDNYDEAKRSPIRYVALQEERVFRHHITNARIAIPALDIDLPWFA